MENQQNQDQSNQQCQKTPESQDTTANPSGELPKSVHSEATVKDIKKWAEKPEDEAQLQEQTLKSKQDIPVNPPPMPKQQAPKATAFQEHKDMPPMTEAQKQAMVSAQFLAEVFNAVLSTFLTNVKRRIQLAVEPHTKAATMELDYSAVVKDLLVQAGEIQKQVQAKENPVAMDMVVMCEAMMAQAVFELIISSSQKLGKLTPDKLEELKQELQKQQSEIQNGIFKKEAKDGKVQEHSGTDKSEMPKPD